MRKLYRSDGDDPFSDDGTTLVYRDEVSQKWFAIFMTVKNPFDPKGGMIDVLNLKLLPNRVQGVMDGRSIFPAYHMNKKHWVSVILDSSLEDSSILSLIKESKKNVEKRKPHRTQSKLLKTPQ